MIYFPIPNNGMLLFLLFLSLFIKQSVVLYNSFNTCKGQSQTSQIQFFCHSPNTHTLQKPSPTFINSPQFNSNPNLQKHYTKPKIHKIIKTLTKNKTTSNHQMFFFSSIYSTFLTCFHTSQTTHDPVSLDLNPNLTTYVYHTENGTVSLTWSRSMLGRSLHVNLHNHSSFHLHLKPWKKHGSKKLSNNTLFMWNLTNARFGSGPEPRSRFYIAILVDNNLNLLTGDLTLKSKSYKPNNKTPQQVLVLKRDHVHVARQRTRVYQTKTNIGGKVREIEIDCDNGFGCEFDDNESLRLLFSVDGEKVLEVKRLKWKFRGSESVEIDGGVHVQISWDVHDWLFEKDKDSNSNEGHAVFMFKFEEEHHRDEVVESGGVWMSQERWGLGCGEKSWSSSTMSMVSSSGGSFGGSSSVMEWSSVEENELVVPLGFSLVVYAWRR